MPISNVNPLINEEIIRRIESRHGQYDKDNAKNKENAKINTDFQKEIPDPLLNKTEMDQEMRDAIDKLSKTVQIFNTRIKLSVDDASKRVVIKIVDSQTDKVIREIPSKEVLNFISRLHQLLGVLIDKKQ